MYDCKRGSTEMFNASDAKMISEKLEEFRDLEKQK
jgi:hypothetical protein